MLNTSFPVSARALCAFVFLVFSTRDSKNRVEWMASRFRPYPIYPDMQMGLDSRSQILGLGQPIRLHPLHLSKFAMTSIKVCQLEGPASESGLLND